jgi:hypothetical protein
MYTDMEPPAGIDFRKAAVLVGGVFAIVLGVVIGTRLSSDAIAVLIGVIAGVVAGVPTALLLIFVTRQRQEYEPEPYEQRYRQMAPPVIVVTPSSAPQVFAQYPGMSPSQQLPPAQGPRRFRVMGLDEEDMEPLEGEAETTFWYG